MKGIISELETGGKDNSSKNAPQDGSVGPKLIGSREYALIENILYTIDRKTEGNLARVVVPTTLIAEFINSSHGDLYSGHPGTKRTYQKLAKFAFWKGMRKDVENKVRTCHFCQGARLNAFRKMVPIKPQVAEFPLHFIQADLVKFYPPSQGYGYVLVLEDRFTKYCCLFPVPDKNAITIAKKFTSFITRFGAPITWGSDNGGEFRNKIIEALCKVYGVRKTYSLAFHPQSNGQCERKNSSIISELSKRVAQYGPNWAVQIPYIEFSYNCSPHTATGVTPYKMMFGREARTPFLSQIPPVDMTGWDNESKKYFSDHQKQLERAHDFAKDHHKKYREQMIAQSSKKGTQPPFLVGSQVWRLIPTEARHKLSMHYDGPWDVKKVLGNTYVIEKDGKELHRPHSDLKVYEKPIFPHEQEKPTMLNEKAIDVLEEEKRQGNHERGANRRQAPENSTGLDSNEPDRRANSP